MELTPTAPSYAFLATGVVDFFPCMGSFPFFSTPVPQISESSPVSKDSTELHRVKGFQAESWMSC